MKHLTVNQVAENYAVKRDTVVAWVKAGLLSSINVAGPSASRPRYRFSSDAILEFERKRAVNNSPVPTKRRARRKHRKEFV